MHAYRTVLSLALLVATGNPSQPTALDRIASLVGGTWVGQETLRLSADGRPFRSLRDYEWAIPGRMIVSRGYYRYEDDGSRELNLYIWFALDPHDGTLLHGGVFADGGLIDGAYLPPTDEGLDLRFVYTDATGTRSSWRAIEEFEGPDRFVETAFVEQDGAWQRVNVLTYVRTRDEEIRP